MAKATSQSKVAAARARLFKQTFANPIRGLTPARLVSCLDAFNRGELREAVLLWQQILDRDDMISPCFDKRVRAVASLDWQILPVDESEPAQKQKQALEHFYNNLTAYDGLNEMERGGVRQLFKQMLTAIAMRYSVHEIIWKPASPGGLTADFKFLPLHFFENTTGRLRFLEADYAQNGAELDEFFGRGSWMCNSGRGLMVASSIAYLFKVPAGLKAWVSFMEKFGMPPLHGQTSAQKNSAEWDEVKDALEGYGEDLAIVTDESTKINPLAVPNAGQAPHAPLVERMDRAISRLWMGGDLATMSKDGQAVGSNAQTDDLTRLQEDDAAMISDALQEYVDTQVIRQIFGDGATPLAYFELVVPKKRNTEDSVRRIETAHKHGVEISKKYVRQELALPEPDDDEELIRSATPTGNAFLQSELRAAANERQGDVRLELFRAQAARRLGRAQADALRPLTDRLSEILGMDDETAQDTALLKLQNDLPSILRSINADEDLIRTWEEILGTALAGGAAATAQAQKSPSSKQ